MCVAAASSTRFSFRLGTSAFALAEFLCHKRRRFI